MPDTEKVLEVLPAGPDPWLGRRVRVGLGLLALGLTGVFAIAWFLQPTDEQGNARRLGVHRQLGLPPCTFHQLTGVPCPSCGMTTSFSHLVHGDVLNSLRANPTGLLLALGCLTAIPWCLVSAVCGRRLGIRNYESLAAKGVILLLVVMMTTWGARLIFDF